VIGIAVSAYRMWNMIPRKHRRRIVKSAAKHGPRVAAKAAKRVRHRVPKPKR
jgi:hypothetical protein